MGYPSDTDWPGAIDSIEDRTDNVDIVWAADYDYQDKQIRAIQEWIGETGKLIGENVATVGGPGPIGMISPALNGATGFKFATLVDMTSGTLVTFGDNQGGGYQELARINYAGLLWTDFGADFGSGEFLRIPHGNTLPTTFEEARLFHKDDEDTLYASDGTQWNPVGGGGGSTTLSSTYTYTQAAAPVEEVAGNGAFNGGNVQSGTPYFRVAVTNQFSISGTTRVRLYDMGTPTVPSGTPRLVSEIVFSSNGGPRSAEQALTIVSGGVASGDDKILDVERVYEVVVIQDISTPGDVAYLGPAVIEVRRT